MVTHWWLGRGVADDLLSLASLFALRHDDESAVTVLYHAGLGEWFGPVPRQALQGYLLAAALDRPDALPAELAAHDWLVDASAEAEQCVLRRLVLGSARAAALRWLSLPHVPTQGPRPWTRGCTPCR
jgi:hypothetical protein